MPGSSGCRVVRQRWAVIAPCIDRQKKSDAAEIESPDATAAAEATAV